MFYGAHDQSVPVADGSVKKPAASIPGVPAGVARDAGSAEPRVQAFGKNSWRESSISS